LNPGIEAAACTCELLYVYVYVYVYVWISEILIMDIHNNYFG